MFKAKHPKIHNFEKRVLDGAVDKYTNKLVHKLGYRRANWMYLLQVLLMSLIVLNTLVCIYRADFVTTTSVVVAILFISDTGDINRDKFRWLPLLQFFSILYDFFWLMFIQNYSKEYDYENYIKGWSLTISWI